MVVVVDAKRHVPTTIGAACDVAVLLTVCVYVYITVSVCVYVCVSVSLWPCVYVAMCRFPDPDGTCGGIPTTRPERRCVYVCVCEQVGKERRAYHLCVPMCVCVQLLCV